MQLSACSPEQFVVQQTQVSENDLLEANVIDGETIRERKTHASKSVVAVEMLGEGRKVLTYCTGVLIGPQTVLSAAHCFNPKLIGGEPVGFNIVFETNTNRLPPSATRRNGSGFIQHPQYNSENRQWVYRDGQFIDPNSFPGFNFLPNDEQSFAPESDHDLVVLVFRGDLPRGFTTTPIDTDVEANYVGQTTYFYGYGRSIDYFDRKGAIDTTTGQLRKGTAKVDTDFSRHEDRYYTSLASKNSLCQGDSGGPQFFQSGSTLKVIGINSAVSVDESSINTIKQNDAKMISCRTRSQVAKVAPYANWIKKTESKLLKDLMKEGR